MADDITVILPSMHLSTVVNTINTNFKKVSELSAKVDEVEAAIPTIVAGKGISVSTSSDGATITISNSIVAAYAFLLFGVALHTFLDVEDGQYTEIPCGLCFTASMSAYVSVSCTDTLWRFDSVADGAYTSLPPDGYTSALMLGTSYS